VRPRTHALATGASGIGGARGMHKEAVSVCVCVCVYERERA
jgi:hypothetical protein